MENENKSEVKVRYRNELNQLPLRGFDKAELNIFYAICVKVKNKNDSIVVLTFDELRTMTAYKEHTEEFIKSIRATNKKLLMCPMEHLTENTITDFVLFDTFEINTREQRLTIQVNKKYMWLLSNVVEQFTEFDFNTFVSMSGIYSKGLFKILKQWRSQGCTRKYTVDELEILLDTPKYPPKILMRDVINPALKELEEKSNLKNIEVETVRKAGRGRPIDGYIFHFCDDTMAGQITLEAYISAFQPATKPKKTKAKNKFNEFESQKYNIDELENQILAN